MLGIEIYFYLFKGIKYFNKKVEEFKEKQGENNPEAQEHFFGNEIKQNGETIYLTSAFS